MKMINETKLQKANKINLLICILIFMYTLLNGCDDTNIKQNGNTFNMPDGLFDSKGYIDLEGEWKFSIGDDTIWASTDYNDWDWEDIKVPSAWENEGFHGYNGYAWYRKTFDLDKEQLASNFILNAGFIDDIDQTYVNGKLVGLSGGFPPDFVTSYNTHREYYVPKEILKKGENLIAIRVYDSQLEGGITMGAVGLNPTQSNVVNLAQLELDVNLSGTWTFKTGDDMNWNKKNYDDAGWRNIFVPAFWEVQGFKDYDGFAWYRKTFSYPEKLAGEKMILLLGKIDDIDQTYVNGQLVGSIGDWNFDEVPVSFNLNYEWETFRGYYIPENLLQPGKENTIAVRVYDGFVDGGIYQGPIGIVSQEKYRNFWNKKKEVGNN